MNWLIWTPFIVLGTLLLLFGLAVLLGRVAGGRYLASDRGRSLEGAVPQAVVRADVERCAGTENPELASAIRKLQRFGTPTTPEGAQRALARLTPGERRAYMQAAGQQAGGTPQRRTARPVGTATEEPPAQGEMRAHRSRRQKR